MTHTDTTQPRWHDLSADEQAALRTASQHGLIMPREMRTRMFDLSLAGHNDLTGEAYLTQVGIAVLAQATAPTTGQPLPGGGDLEALALAINKGWQMAESQSWSLNASHFNAHGEISGVEAVEPDILAGVSAWVEYKAHVEAELAASRAAEANARAEVAGLTERGSLIEWAIECAKVWVEFVNSDDNSEQPLEAMTLTMNVLRSKVADYQRKQANAALKGTE